MGFVFKIWTIISSCFKKFKALNLLLLKDKRFVKTHINIKPKFWNLNIIPRQDDYCLSPANISHYLITKITWPHTLRTPPQHPAGRLRTAEEPLPWPSVEGWADLGCQQRSCVALGRGPPSLHFPVNLTGDSFPRETHSKFLNKRFW